MFSIENNPVTAILGPRQSGKSTLVKHLQEKWDSSVYLDLERPSDLRKLFDPELYLNAQKGKLICLDEIQRRPELFAVLRSLTDEWGGNGHFLILGSATRELLKQSSESLAGRISYKILTPFLLSEGALHITMEQFIVRGGFPRSLLAENDGISFSWREDFISTFLERDLLQWSGASSVTMRRLWQMLAHVNGQPVNYSALANSLSVSNVTVRNYIDLLAATFMIHMVPPWFSNLKKRLIRSPRVYIADSGICSALLSLKSYDQCLGHPSWGSIWEQIVLTNLKGTFQGAEFFFYRTAAGAEMDLVMKYREKVFAIECKSSVAPVLSKGTFLALEDIRPDYTFVVAPVAAGWPVKKEIEVVSIPEIIAKIEALTSLS